jgi:hypothetical protein
MILAGMGAINILIINRSCQKLKVCFVKKDHA